MFILPFWCTVFIVLLLCQLAKNTTFFFLFKALCHGFRYFLKSLLKTGCLSNQTQNLRTGSDH